MTHPPDIFNISSPGQFNEMAIGIFRHQYRNNPVYREFADLRRIRPEEVSRIEEIPFLPVELFKSRDVYGVTAPPQETFLSSGTTGTERSRHMVYDLGLYRQSFTRGFSRFYGNPADVQFLALTPTPDQAQQSSLVYMIRNLMDLSSSPENGYFLANHSGLTARLRQKRAKGKKVMMIGLAYALLDFAEACPGNYGPLIVVETGGMKGHRREMVREELHSLLCNNLGVDAIHSEYGMTELLSQAWSAGNGLFTAPPWMKILLRDVNDPFTLIRGEATGCINIIDLANFHSCSFIATQDLGRIRPDSTFEVMGRHDQAEARGCSLMI